PTYPHTLATRRSSDLQVGAGSGRPRPAVGVVNLNPGKMGRLIDHLPELNGAGIPPQNLFHPLFLQVGPGQAVGPDRYPIFLVPEERVAFHADLPRGAP